MSNQGSAFARGVALQQAGEFMQAACVLEQLLRIDPQHAAAWHHLGLAVHCLGQGERAAECISRAVALDGSNAIFHGDLGAICHQLGRFDEALECLQQAVQLAPEHAQAHYNLGTVLQQRGDAVGAKFRFQQTVRLRPDFAEAWKNLGIAHQALGEFDEAGDCFEKLTALIPDSPDGYFCAGNLWLAQDRPLEAVASYSLALERQRDFPEALGNLGYALHRLGQFEQARKAYLLALQIAPNFSEARNNLGALLSLMGRHADAEACYREALRLDPQSAPARNNLAGILQQQMRLVEAEQLLRESLAINPQAVNSLGNLANVLAQQGQVVDAEMHYRQALERQPNPRLRIQAALMLPPVYETTDEIARCRETVSARLAQLEADRVAFDPAREQVAVNFLMPYQGLNDRDLARRLAGLYRPAASPVSSASGPAAPHFPARRAAKKEQASESGTSSPSGAKSTAPVRIGFLSRFLRDHSIGDLTKGLIQHLSRRDFVVTVFLVGDAEDETVASLRQAAGAIVNLPEDVSVARQAVDNADLDVLVYPDVGMEPVSTTLAFSRLARVQCAMWGHPVTTGIPAIDHFISSKLIEPADAAGHYTENLALLESLPTYYYRPRLTAGSAGQDSIDREWTHDGTAARKEFGLPQGAHLYLCPQSLFKFHPEFDPLLAAILARDPAARLVLLDAPHAHWTEKLSQRFAKNLGGNFDQVSFVPRVDRARFLRLLPTADVVLDPLHFGGGNTSFQALGLGVPIVTLPASFMRGRVTAGCYRKMGFETCVATNAEEYVNLAVRLGTDPAFNAHVRAEINSHSAALFEDSTAVRELEEFFKSACQRSPQRAMGFIPMVSG